MSRFDVGINEIAKVFEAEKSGELESLKIPKKIVDHILEVLNGTKFLWFYLSDKSRGNCSKYFREICDDPARFSEDEQGILSLSLSKFLSDKDFRDYATEELGRENLAREFKGEVQGLRL